MKIWILDAKTVCWQSGNISIGPTTAPSMVSIYRYCIAVRSIIWPADTPASFEFKLNRTNIKLYPGLVSQMAKSNDPPLFSDPSVHSLVVISHIYIYQLYGRLGNMKISSQVHRAYH